MLEKIQRCQWSIHSPHAFGYWPELQRTGVDRILRDSECDNPRERREPVDTCEIAWAVFAIVVCVCEGGGVVLSESQET